MTSFVDEDIGLHTKRIRERERDPDLEDIPLSDRRGSFPDRAYVPNPSLRLPPIGVTQPSTTIEGARY